MGVPDAAMAAGRLDPRTVLPASHDDTRFVSLADAEHETSRQPLDDPGASAVTVDAIALRFIVA